MSCTEVVSVALFRCVSYVAANSFSTQFRTKELLRVTIIIILDLRVNFFQLNFVLNILFAVQILLNIKLLTVFRMFSFF